MENRRNILYGDRQLGLHPMEKLKQVDEPTTRITGDIRRVDERNHGFNRFARGDYGPVPARGHTRPVSYPIAGAERDMSEHLGPILDGRVGASKVLTTEDPLVLSRHVKKLAYFLGADIVGICRLPQYAVYSHGKDGNPIELHHQFAIVIAVDQGYETMKASSGSDWISASQSYRSYTTMSFISCMVANYIRRLGYPARAHSCSGYQVVMPPLLLLAGIGEMSRMGNSVVNPFLGARFKAAAVTTDLPLATDKPVDFGLQKFCQACKRCAEECPSKAISNGDKVIYNGYECWQLDVERCTKFRILNPHGSACGRCIKVCPWNKPSGWLHDRARWIAGHTPWLDGFLVRMDSVMGYSKQHREDQWWFDCEKIDGLLTVPSSHQDKRGIPNDRGGVEGQKWTPS